MKLSYCWGDLMRCDKCGIKLDDGMKFCYECGTSVNEKEQIREAEASLSAFFESRENLMKKDMPKEKDFVYTTFGKVLFAFVGFGIFAMSVSFIKGNVVSGIVAVVMTLCALVAYLIGAEAIAVKSRSVKFSVALVALLFVIPFFCAYKLEVPQVPARAASSAETDELSRDEDAENEQQEETTEDVADEAVPDAETAEGTRVYTTPSGKKYHMTEGCAGKNAIPGVLEEVKAKYDPCKKCVK